MNTQTIIQIPHILTVIVDRKRAERIAESLHKEDVTLPFTYVCMAEGTASSDVMDMLGLDSSDKAILLTMVPSTAASYLLGRLNERLSLHKAKMGIAFTIPISGIGHGFRQKIDDLANAFGFPAPDNHDVNAQANGQIGVDVEMNISHDLIVAVINQGYSDDLMDSARKAGATGGTVIRARRVNGEDAQSFFGIHVQSEKEIVTILTRREDKQKIIDAIKETSGSASKASGIILSLPVDGVAGLS